MCQGWPWLCVAIPCSVPWAGPAPWGLWQGSVAVEADTGCGSRVFLFYIKLNEIHSPVGLQGLTALF